MAASVALLTVLAPASAEAASKSKRGDLKVFFENTTALQALELDAVADGPSHREKSLDNGECKKWDVRKGQYKITLDDADEFFDAAFAGQFVQEPEFDFVSDACGADARPDFSVEVAPQR